MPLSDLAIKNACPKEKRYTLFDTGGLYIEISPNGGKWWRFRYRVDGKTKVMSLGTYPEVSLKAARNKRDTARLKVANGEDPSAKRDNLLTFQDVAQEWLEHRKKDISQETIKFYTCYFNKYIVKEIPKKPIDKLNTQDFLSVFRNIEKRDHLVTAKRLSQMCSLIIKYAKISGLIKVNPIEDISQVLLTRASTHRASITNPEEVGKLLLKILNYKTENPFIGLALRIIPYVFVRSSELCNAVWNEFDFDNALWIIPAERMKKRREHVVPLARQVIELFEKVRKISTNEICFPRRSDKSKPIKQTYLLRALRSIGYGQQDMCTHGFRSTASTLLNEQGYRPDIIELQLAHVDKNTIRAIYNRAQYLEERREMMQHWADYLDGLREKAAIEAN